MREGRCLGGQGADPTRTGHCHCCEMGPFRNVLATGSTWWLAAVLVYRSKTSDALPLIAGNPTREPQAVRPSAMESDLGPTLLKEAAESFAVPSPPYSYIPLQEPALV